MAVIIIGTWVFLMEQREAPGEISKILFGVLTGSALLYSLLSGIRDTADCVSSEKREGTLGLLFLTDLKGYDVVIGKMTANSLNAFYSVLAVLPMMAVPLLMGGVEMGEFGRAALVIVNTLFFSLTLGLCMSSVSRSGRRAATLTFVLLVLFAVVVPAFGLWHTFLHNRNWPVRGFLAPSPIANYVLAWDGMYKGHEEDFWWAVGVIHGLAWLSLLFASLVAPRSWQDRPAGVQQLRWRERWQLWSHGDIQERHGFRKRLLDQNPFFWLAARARLKPALAWGSLGLLGCGWALGLSKFHRDWLCPPVYIMTGVVLSLGLKAWFATEAGRQIAEDRKRGALELLLSTPITVRDILRGQLLALRRHFFGPLIFVLIVGCLFFYGSLLDGQDEESRSSYRIFWIGGMVTLVSDLVALYWVGLWLGLTAKNPNRAASASVARVLILPGIAWSLLLLILALNSMRGGYQAGFNVFLSLWFVLGLLTDFAFSVWARNKLLTQFRLAATRRYLAQPGFLKRLFTGDTPGEPGTVATAHD